MDRFQQIRKMIYFTDPEAENAADSLRKLKYFVDYLRNKYMEYYVPENHLAIDEYLSMWKGRLDFVSISK